MDNGRKALIDMIRNPKQVYKVDRSVPGTPYYNAYRVNEAGEIETWYSGCRGWARSSYTDDWEAFLNHIGARLQIVGDAEAAGMK